MNHRIRILSISCILLFVFCAVFSWLKSICAAPVPEASHPGGYYEDSFVLRLTAPSNGTIYYTTDGSIPTASSEVYCGGIPIRNRSGEPNVYASIQNVVTDWKDYSPDETPVPKGTVIRALFVNDVGISSQIFTQTYFVGLTPPEAGYTLSLIFEYEDLFGDNGIYVTGKEYDDWYLSGQQTEPAPVPNFLKRLEVPVIAELMGPSGELMNHPVSLRLQGNSKRGWIQKRFILAASAELSGSNLFPVELFPNTATHSIMTKDPVADVLVHDFVSDRNVSTQKSTPVRLFLNGEFLYNWYILERYDNQYFRQYYDVDDIIFVKDSAVDEDVTVDRDAYGELMYWAAHTDFTDEAEWAQIQSEVDIQSYIDYIAINYYFCNWDFSDDKNHVLWRSTFAEDKPYADRKWHWCIYDVDALHLTRGNYDVENAAEVNIFSCDLPYSDVKVNETVLFKALKCNPDFRKQFVLSFMDIGNNNFSAENVTAVLEKHGLPPDWVDGYFLKRTQYAPLHLAQEFGLTGTVETLTVTAKDPAMGNITVNTSQIDLSGHSWSGRYFTDYPITLTAEAKEGYEFIGWKGDADTSDATLTLPMTGSTTLEAVFAEAP